MINDNLYNKPRSRPVVAPKAKAAGRLFLKLHTMPRLASRGFNKWLGLGLLVAAAILGFIWLLYR